MDLLYESATQELQEELNDANYQVVFDNIAQEYQIQQYIEGEGWVVSACYRFWNAKVRQEYKKYYYQSHEGVVEHQVWREAKQKERAKYKEQEEKEASLVGRETGEDIWKLLRDNHAVKRGVY